MKSKRTGCLFLFFLLIAALFVIIMTIFEKNPGSFWWVMAGAAAVVALAAVLVRIFGKKPGNTDSSGSGQSIMSAPEKSRGPGPGAPLSGDAEAQSGVSSAEAASEPPAAGPADAQQSAPEAGPDASVSFAPDSQEERLPTPPGEPAVAAEPSPAWDSGTLIYAGSYSVGVDIPAGKYDFRALRGKGTLSLKKADGSARLCTSLGTEDSRASVEYRNAVCEDGDTLAIDGSVVVAVRKSTPIVFI